jgi:hypothetical protein
MQKRKGISTLVVAAVITLTASLTYYLGLGSSGAIWEEGHVSRGELLFAI